MIIVELDINSVNCWYQWSTISGNAYGSDNENEYGNGYGIGYVISYSNGNGHDVASHAVVYRGLVLPPQYESPKNDCVGG